MYITSGIMNACNSDENFAKEIDIAIAKFARNDWGDSCKYDKQQDKNALVNGDRIVALYNTSKGRVFIITETDRNITTVLFGHEY